MRSAGLVAGILAIGWSTESEQLYRDTDLRLPASFAEQATLALQVAQAQEDRGRLRRPLPRWAGLPSSLG